MVRLPISRCVRIASRPSSLVRRCLSDSKLVQSARTAVPTQEIRINSEQMYTEQPMKILNSKGYTLLILNGDHTNPDALSRDNFNRFWTQSMYRVAVDGGLTNPLIIGKMARIENEILRDSIDCVTIKIE